MKFLVGSKILSFGDASVSLIPSPLAINSMHAEIHFRQEAGNRRILKQMDDWFVLFHSFDDIVPGFFFVFHLLPTSAFFSCQGFFPTFFGFGFRLWPKLFPCFDASFPSAGWSRYGWTLRLLFWVGRHDLMNCTRDLWNGRVCNQQGKRKCLPSTVSGSQGSHQFFTVGLARCSKI